MLYREDVYVWAGQPPAISGTARSKSDACAIGRPCRVFVVPIAIGELSGFTAGDIDQKQVLTLIMNKPNTIEAVKHSINDSHFCHGLTLLGLFIQWANRCTKNQFLAVRRPDGIGGSMRHEGELMSFTSIGRNEP